MADVVARPTGLKNTKAVFDLVIDNRQFIGLTAAQALTLLGSLSYELKRYAETSKAVISHPDEGEPWLDWIIKNVIALDVANTTNVHNRNEIVEEVLRRGW